MFNDMVRKDCLWEKFVSSRKLSVNVLDSIRFQKINPVQVWPDSQGNDREAELDSGQI